MSEQEKIPLPTELAAKWRAEGAKRLPSFDPEVQTWAWAIDDCAAELDASIAAIPDVEELAEKLRDDVWDDMKGRKGFDPRDYGIAADIIVEWRDTWNDIILAALQQAVMKGVKADPVLERIWDNPEDSAAFDGDPE